MGNSIQWNELEAMPDDREFEAYHKCSARWQTAAFHAHEFYEFYFYISGSTEIVLENYFIKMEPGDLIILPPGYMHRALVTDSTVRYERMYLYVGRDCLRSMSAKDFNLLQIVESCVLHEHFRFPLDPETFSRCKAQIDQVIAASGNPLPSQQLINRCRFNILLATVCNAMADAKEEGDEAAPSRMNELILYIQDHIAEELKLDALAERFFVSKYHLLHEFKAYTNTSLYQYILSKRIIYAKILLQTNLSPGDVYAKCGFSDYSCFYKAFRKEMGLSPQKYVMRITENARERHDTGKVRHE